MERAWAYCLNFNAFLSMLEFMLAICYGPGKLNRNENGLEEKTGEMAREPEEEERKKAKNSKNRTAGETVSVRSLFPVRKQTACSVVLHPAGCCCS
uniref:Uncharacterized protein n=1 Tax=Setaria viridis TaxID=4556 RepID=A0A4U6WBY5_SETVI|nr:hypothetical protein SEVIR_1G115233v2 [Setaria viridis]